MTQHNPNETVRRLKDLVESLVASGHKDIIRAAEANLEALNEVALYLAIAAP